MKNMLVFKSRIYLTKIQPSLRYYSSNASNQSSGLHKIETSHTNPIQLFRQWFEEHVGVNHNDQFLKVCCVSTASKNGDISSRNLILRRLDEDGFVILTDNRSYKSKHINENPQASIVFLWNKIISNSNFTRQVRIKGTVKQLPNSDTEAIFQNETLFAKIRALICNQGKPVEWDSLKKQHDDILHEYKSNNKIFTKPEYVVSYKIFPQYLDFYETLGAKIADRLLFTKANGSWNITRIAA